MTGHVEGDLSPGLQSKKESNQSPTNKLSMNGGRFKSSDPPKTSRNADSQKTNLLSSGADMSGYTGSQKSVEGGTATS